MADRPREVGANIGLVDRLSNPLDGVSELLRKRIPRRTFVPLYPQKPNNGRYKRLQVIG